jgi:hypothetical protein
LNSNSRLRRQETKYFVTSSELFVLRSLLQNLMDLDTHANKSAKTYKVTSLYFETINDSDLDEKLDGINERAKYRLRMYNRDPSLIKLEIKKKNGFVIQKDSIIIDRQTAYELMHGKFCELLSKSHDTLSAIYPIFRVNGYRPSVIVEYDREAYVLPYGNIRFSFDENLVTFGSPRQFLELSGKGTPVFDEKVHILEVKSSIGIPTHLKNILSQIRAIRSSASKYTFGRRFSDHRRWRDIHRETF